MEDNASCSSPKEEGELEDGEIFDDEPQSQARPPRRARNNRAAQNRRARLPGHMMKNNNNSSNIAPLPLRGGGVIPAAPHPLFPVGLRQGSGFWERSHDALGPFRYRTQRASGWTRDWTERFAEIHGGRTTTESQCRKRILTSNTRLFFDEQSNVMLSLRLVNLYGN